MTLTVRENERKSLGFQNFCSARKLWMDPVALVGRKTRARQGHLSLCTRLLPVKGKSFAWKIPARDFFLNWIVENMLEEREAGYWPSPFWWVSLQDFSAPNSGNKVWTTSSVKGFLVSKWMRQNNAGRLASVLLFLIHFTNGFIAISSSWFSKMAKWLHLIDEMFDNFEFESNLFQSHSVIYLTVIIDWHFQWSAVF